MNPEALRHPASYRDPSGFVFLHEGRVYRSVAPGYLPDYEQLLQSGLYAQLSAKGWLLPHEELGDTLISPDPHAALVLRPQQVQQWSYPYEWSFSQLKDAALLTLHINRAALENGMILKDAAAYNVQFVQGRPVFIDTLSFERYREGEAWKGFRQFCRQFLYPLLLQVHQPAADARLLMAYPEGLEARMVAPLAPRRKRLNMNYWLYVFLPARMEAGKQAKDQKVYQVSKNKVLQNMQQLESFISGLQLPAAKTTWNDYYTETILSKEYLDNKKEVVNAWLAKYLPETVCDLGCNDGVFSLLAAQYAQTVWAADGDSACIESLYCTTKQQKIQNILPLISDLTNPVPDMGWNHAERRSFSARVSSSLVMSLALIHHLCLGSNVPLDMVASWFRQLTKQHLLIEFVPKDDPKAQLLLQHKGDLFPAYTQQHFEAAFAAHFELVETASIQGSNRTLYLFRTRQ